MVRLTLSGGAHAHTSSCQTRFSKTPMASSTGANADHVLYQEHCGRGTRLTARSVRRAELTLAPFSPNEESNQGIAGQVCAPPTSGFLVQPATAGGDAHAGMVDWMGDRTR